MIISSTGVISVRDGAGTINAQRGQLQIAGFDQPQKLQKDGGFEFLAPAGVELPVPRPQDTRIVQGAVEKSNVSAISEMSRMIEITRSYADIAGILQQ